LPSPLGAVALLALPLAGFSGGTTPAPLPRGDQVPIGLSAGFTSEDPSGGPAPGLRSIRIELSRRLSLRIAGRPLCPERLLYKGPAVTLEECEGSLVGRGTVVSDIPVSTNFDQTARVEGTMRVFYGLAEGKPMMLARVETGEPMPLVYVIPFAIKRSSSGRATLVAHRMTHLRGLCARSHPNCFADPYGIDGFYTRIASLQLTLRRVGRSGLVSGSCPPRSAATFTLEQIELSYVGGSEVGGSVDGTCR
jgi:hypothetical protein